MSRQALEELLRQPIPIPLWLFNYLYHSSLFTVVVILVPTYFCIRQLFHLLSHPPTRDLHPRFAKPISIFFSVCFIAPVVLLYFYAFMIGDYNFTAWALSYFLPTSAVIWFFVLMYAAFRTDYPVVADPLKIKQFLKREDEVDPRRIRQRPR